MATHHVLRPWYVIIIRCPRTSQNQEGLVMNQSFPYGLVLPEQLHETVNKIYLESDSNWPNSWNNPEQTEFGVPVTLAVLEKSVRSVVRTMSAMSDVIHTADWEGLNLDHVDVVLGALVDKLKAELDCLSNDIQWTREVWPHDPVIREHFEGNGKVESAPETPEAPRAMTA
jgi:hypothetical protein